MNENYYSLCWDACQYAVSQEEEIANIEDVVFDSLLSAKADKGVAYAVVSACEAFEYRELALNIFRQYNIL